MKRVLIALAIVTVAAAADAQQRGRQRSVTAPAPIAADWKIELTSSGGLTGGGVGGLIVSSNGALIVTFGSNPKRCTYQLNADELSSLTAAVGNLRPRSWTECFSLADVSTHCCDLVRTNLTLTSRGGRDMYATSWITGAELPQDLQRLIETLQSADSFGERYRRLCAKQ